MDNLIPIENSSNLTGYYYEPLTKCLFIEFRGGALYSYDLVPPEVVVAFQAAPSKGSFLARHIKDKYKCTKFEKNDAEKPSLEEIAKKEENSENNAGN